MSPRRTPPPLPHSGGGAWLPRGRLAGPTFGLAAFVMVSPFIDPLRADNVDFDIIGPGWLAVTVFAALGVVQGRSSRHSPAGSAGACRS